MNHFDAVVRAEDAIDEVVRTANLTHAKPSRTLQMPLVGAEGMYAYFNFNMNELINDILSDDY